MGLHKKNKRNSVLFPGEGLGDYLKAYHKSGLTRPEFDELRLNPPEKIDPEAIAERLAIQNEGLSI